MRAPSEIFEWLDEDEMELKYFSSISTIVVLLISIHDVTIFLSLI